MLWLALLALPVIVLGWRSLVTIDRFRQAVAIAFRLLILAIAILLLAGLEIVRDNTSLTVIAAVDQSLSMQRITQPPTPDTNTLPSSDTIAPSIKNWLQSATKSRRVDDRLGLVGFDNRPTVLSLPARDINFDRAARTPPEDGTLAANAIRLAMAQFPADSSKRLLLVTDGNDADQQQLLAAAREAKAANVPIDVLPVDYHLADEVMIDRLYAPAQAGEGQTLPLRIVLRATRPIPGKLFLLHDQTPVDLTPDQLGQDLPVLISEWTVGRQPLTSADQADTPRSYLCVKQIEIPNLSVGINSFKAVFEPAARLDTIALNNSAQSFTLVTGQGKVLLLTNAQQSQPNPLAVALQNHNINLQISHSHFLDNSLAGLQRYDAIILQNLPADDISIAQQDTIKNYVHELGGGLLMIGGPNSFGAGGWTAGPVDQTLPVNCEVPSQTVLLSGALVLVLDRSGSMAQKVSNTQYTQQQVANEASLLALQSLFTEDYVGVIAFDNSPKWIHPLSKNTDALATAKKIMTIEPGGGTNIYPALKQAYDALSALNPNDTAVRHVILLTDGESKPGNFAAIARQMAQANITLSTVGVGDKHDAALLKNLAETTGGSYHPVINPLDLPQIFIKEARTIRRSLIKDKTFTPITLDTGSPITANLPAPPPLHGMVLTSPKPDPRVFLAMTGIDNAPLFAHWQFGLGRSAAFTSEASGSWAADWIAWPNYSDFWSRTIRTIARPTATTDYDLIADIRGNQLVIELQNPELATATQWQGLSQITGSVLKPGGQTQRITLKQISPDTYRTAIPATDTGNYIISLIAKDRQNNAQSIFGGATRLPGQELRDFQSNRQLVEQIASITGGRVLSLDQFDNPGAPGLFNRAGITPSRSIQPLTRPLLIWLIILFLLDVAVRRIVWDIIALRNRLLGFLGLTKPTRTAESSAQTLANLRTRVGDFQRPQSPDSQTKTPPATPTDMPVDQTWLTYEQPEQTQHHADEPQPAIDDNRDLAATTSRLLAAKKRAQNRNHKNDS